MTQQGARPVLSASWGMTAAGAELSQGGEMPRPCAGAAGLAQDLCGPAQALQSIHPGTERDFSALCNPP